MKVLKKDIDNIHRLIKYLSKASKLADKITFDETGIKHLGQNLSMRYKVSMALSDAENLLHGAEDKYMDQ